MCGSEVDGPGWSTGRSVTTKVCLLTEVINRHVIRCAPPTMRSFSITLLQPERIF